MATDGRFVDARGGKGQKPFPGSTSPVPRNGGQVPGYRKGGTVREGGVVKLHKKERIKGKRKKKGRSKGRA